MHPELVENMMMKFYDFKPIVIHLGVGVYVNVSLRGTDCLHKSLDTISFNLASV